MLFLMRELAQTGECELVVPHEGTLSAEARACGIEVVVQPYPMLVSLWRPNSALLTEVQQLIHEHLHILVRLMEMRRPDLVFVNTAINPLPAVAAKQMGIPSIWNITEVISANCFRSLSVHFIQHYADRIVGISDATLRPFREARHHRKLTCLPPSWDEHSLEPEAWHEYRVRKREELGAGERHTVVGYIASDWVEPKGLRHFIDMAVRLCAELPDVRFWAVGNPTDAAYVDACKRQVVNAGLANRFMYAGFQQKIQHVYPAMDIVVVPSLAEEGFGMTAMEGLLFGKPVVAYASGGLAEILTSTGNEALLVEPGDAAQLAMTVKHLIADERHRREIAERNRQTVGAVFGIEAYRERLAQLMRFCVAGGCGNGHEPCGSHSA